MLTLINDTRVVMPSAVLVHFTNDAVHISLSDGQIIHLDLGQHWLRWLAAATPEQRTNWSLEPRGNAVYWEDLDDGIEICHVLELQETP
jgi:Protein of unknown function (DUF2442)